MTTQFPAIVEHGILRPLVPIALKEGAQVEVLVISPGPFISGQDAAAALAEIAAIPPQGDDPTIGDRHDEILYDREVGS